MLNKKLMMKLVDSLTGGTDHIYGGAGNDIYMGNGLRNLYSKTDK